MSPRHAPEGLKIKLVAQLLSVSERTVHRWIRHGYLVAHKVGPRLVRVPRSELIRMRAVRLPFIKHGDRPEYPHV